jgi:FkbM family methyltransferase
MNNRLRIILRNQKRNIQSVARRLAERLGIKRFSKPGLFEMDDKLSRHLGHRGGFFIECGANDGFRQSNTYFLERFRGWTGLLIEPVPELHDRCRKLRRKSICVRYALVGPDYTGSEIEITYAGLMSVVKGAFSDQQRAYEHVANGLNIQNISKYVTVAPVSTLSSLLDRLSITRRVDFLSLDVEGFEEEALRGLDLSRHRPLHILVEARNPEKVRALLGEHYRLVEQLTHHDYLFSCIDD